MPTTKQSIEQMRDEIRVYVACLRTFRKKDQTRDVIETGKRIALLIEILWAGYREAMKERFSSGK